MADSPSRDERVAAYLERIASSEDFPALSGRITEVMQVVSSEGATMQHMANIILKDYSLTLKVLRTANSFHYNRVGRPILSVTQAMVVLGTKNVRDLARALLVLEHYQRQSPGLKELMLLSMLTASHARDAAEHVGYHRPEEAHLLGMFRNLGEVLVACHGPTDYAAVLQLVEDEHLRPADACLQVLGFRYEDLGEALCRTWGITGASAAADRGERSLLERLVAFGHELTTAVYRREGGDSRATMAALMQKHGTALDLTDEQLREILRRGIAETKEVFESLRVSINDLRLRRQRDEALAALAPDGSHVTTEGEGAPDADPGASAPVRDQLVEAIDASISAPDPFELNQVLLTILEAIFRAGPFDHAAFCVVGADLREAVGRFGLGDGIETRLDRLRFPVSIARSAAPFGPALVRRLELVLSASRNLPAEDAQGLQRLGVQTLALLPVVVDGHLVGALYADRIQEQAPPDAPTLTFLSRVRELACQAIGRARRASEAARARTTASAKYDTVLRVLRGESVEVVSRELGMAAADVDQWRRDFLAGALSGLKDRE